MRQKQKGDEIVADRQVVAQEREVKAAVTLRMGKAEEKDIGNLSGETSAMLKRIRCGVQQAVLTLAQDQAEGAIGKKRSMEAGNEKKRLKGMLTSLIQSRTTREKDITGGEKDLDPRE